MIHPISSNSGRLFQINWLTWLLFLGVVVLFSYPSLRWSPLPWQDEIHIVDIGRTMSAPETSFAVAWYHSLNRAQTSMYYPGCWIANFLFEVTGDRISHRLLTLAAAALAASLLAYLLQLLGTDPRLAFLAAAGFFLDPSFAEGYRGGRVDSLAMALALGSACCAFRAGKAPGTSLAYLGGASALGVLAFLVWPTALVTLLLCPAAYFSALGSPTLLRIVRDSITVALISAVVAFLVLFPFLEIFPTNKSIATSLQKRSWGYLCTLIFHSFEKSSPVVIASTIATVFLWRQRLACHGLWPFITAVILGFVLVVASKPYIHRTNYVLPALYLLAACGCQTIPHKPLRQLLTLFLGLALLTGIALTLVGRNYVAWKREKPDPPLVRELLGQSHLQTKTQQTLFTDDWSLYFPARNQGFGISYHTTSMAVENFRDQVLSHHWTLLQLPIPRLWQKALDSMVAEGLILHPVSPHESYTLFQKIGPPNRRNPL